MIEERNVILIGLGSFGQKTIEVFNGLLEERKHQIDKELLKKINIYPIDFRTDVPFNYATLSGKIDEAVKDSRAKKFNNGFSYIFVGDLYDYGTSSYGIDYAYLPWVINQTGSITKEDVLGFFTFAESWGTTVKANEKCMRSMQKYFDDLNAIDFADKYIPPYKDPNGHNFDEVSSPTGPYDRHYIIVTPGTQEEVERDTTQVIAERLFYEIYYLSDKFKELAHHYDSIRKSNNGKLLSGFTMMQISRLEDLQHYYIKYNKEDVISNYLLQPVSQNVTDLNWYKEKFFELVDIPFEEKDFPIDRAVKLFYRENRREKLLYQYTTNSKEDIKDYIQACKERVEGAVKDYIPKYKNWVRSEIDHMLQTFEDGYKTLLNIEQLTGNINTYILFIDEMAKRLKYWEESLKKIVENSEDVTLDELFEEAQQRIEKIQKSKIYKMAFFVPVRQVLINNAILSIDVEQYLCNVIKKELAKAFLVEWQDKTTASRNPVTDCQELVNALKEMRELLVKKNEQIQKKIAYIEKIPSYYYVMSEKDQEEYENLLAQRKGEYFGTSNKTALENEARTFFSKWTADKNRHAITNPSDFIKFFDEFIDDLTSDSMAQIAQDCNNDEYAKWAEECVATVEKYTEKLSKKSFISHDRAVATQKIVLTPIRKNEDKLSEAVKDRIREDDSIVEYKLPREFTLGSVVYFDDYLWMDIEQLTKRDQLVKYSNVAIKSVDYDNTAAEAPVAKPEPEAKPAETVQTEEAPAEELTLMEKHIRSIYLDFCEDWVARAYYNNAFGEEPESLTPAQIDKLSKATKIEELLESLSDEQRTAYAKEIGAPLSPDTETIINNIVMTIRKSM